MAAMRTWKAVAVLGLVGALSVGCSGPNPFQSASETTVVQDQGAPPVTNNDFIPTEQNLSDCIGAVEKPNCGSESKGGWRMYLVFAALVLGMGVVGWRIAVGVRARDAVVNSLPEDTPPTAPAG